MRERHERNSTYSLLLLLELAEAEAASRLEDVAAAESDELDEPEAIDEGAAVTVACELAPVGAARVGATTVAFGTTAEVPSTTVPVAEAEEATAEEPAADEGAPAPLETAEDAAALVAVAPAPEVEGMTTTGGRSVCVSVDPGALLEGAGAVALPAAEVAPTEGAAGAELVPEAGGTGLESAGTDERVRLTDAGAEAEGEGSGTSEVREGRGRGMGMTRPVEEATRHMKQVSVAAREFANVPLTSFRRVSRSGRGRSGLRGRCS